MATIPFEQQAIQDEVDSVLRSIAEAAGTLGLQTTADAANAGIGQPATAETLAGYRLLDRTLWDRIEATENTLLERIALR